MYGGYQGAYGTYANPEYAAANTYQQGAQQPAQQPAQQYYTGVNPYASCYGYGSMTAALQAPPPPPPIPPTDPAYQSFPSSTSTAAASSGISYFRKATPAGNVVPGGYNGYDAAVYSYAQQNKTPPNQSQQYQQQQHQNKNWRHGGGGRQARPMSTDNKQYYCDVCKISCAGGITYKEHLEGKKHKSKEQSAKTGVPIVSLAKNKLSYRCELCDVTCAGQDTYTAHVRGGKHLKTQQLHRKLGKPVPEDVPTIIAPGEDGPTETRAKPKWHQQALPGGKKVIGINTVAFVGGTKLNSTGQIEEKKREVAEAVGSVGIKKPAIPVTIEVEDERLKAMMAAEEVQPIGEEHVTDERDATGKLVLYHCQICDCKFSDPNAKEVHVKGRRHRMSYKQKIDPTFVVDPKPGSGAKKGDKSKTGNKTYERKGPWFSGPLPEGCALNLIDERTVDAKYASLNPGPEFTVNIDQFVSSVTESLRKISDKFAAEDPMKSGNTPETPRDILGCVRSGVFSKNTFIKGEPFLELVLTFTPIPTKELIDRVLKEFPENTTDMTIELDPSSPVIFIITSTLFTDLKCRLIATSPSLRNEADDCNVAINEADCADREECLRGLASIRRAKWYNSHCLYLNSCQQTVRLFRDLRSRYPVWQTLDDYKLELIVATIIDSTPTLLTLTEAFKRVLEAISSGFLFSAKLLDPCEKEETNVLNELSHFQKDEITASAQLFIRLIAFNRIHEILGVERFDGSIEPEGPMPSATLKRTMELISGFDGEKLPEDPAYDRLLFRDEDVQLDNNEDEEGEDGEPDIKRGRINEEEVKPEEAVEPELPAEEGAESMEPEKVVEEGAESME